MKSHIIQSSVFPSYDLCSEPSLYFRSSGVVEFGEQKRVVLPKSSHLFTDTYFNSFSIGKWKNKTGLTDLALSLSFTGEIVLRWWWYQSQGRRASIGEVRLTSSDPVNPVHIPVPQFERLTDGVIAFEVFALADSVIHGFQYVTSMLPRREVRLAISITHFNRQQYVIPAVRRLNEQLLSDPAYSNRVKLFVVDNSQNLKSEDMVGAQVIPNANLGGSGGFMRGLIHVQDAGEFTHCLFMDDDASNEIEAVRRTVALLEYVIDDRTAISGAMLYERHPHIQHENGAWYKGNCQLRGMGWDMLDINRIVENEVEEMVDYGGWWFFAFPLQFLTHYVFPFFVRGDDIYFGLKNNFSILTLNGICSWQEDFAIKDGPLTAYLSIRCDMAQNFLSVFPPKANKKALLRLIHNVFKHYSQSYHYESSGACLDAMDDVIKGPDFWLNNVDMSVRRPEIMKRIKNEKMQDLPTDWRQNFRWSDKSRKKRLNRRLTLNGHLLPLFTFRKYNVALAKGFGGRINDSFRCKKVLCVDVLSQKGYVVEHNKKAFFTQLLRYYRLRYRFWRDYDKLRAAYKARENDLTSRNFWQAQFTKEI